MKARNQGSTLVIFLMLLAVVGVTVGVALTLFPAEARTANFMLSLCTIVFAETLPFCWPIYHSLGSVDQRRPGFAFGLGQQIVFGIYAFGVVVLALIAWAGVAEYSLGSSFVQFEGIRLIEASASGPAREVTEFNGNTRSRLALNRHLDPGVSDVFLITARFRIDRDLADIAVSCSESPNEEGRGLTAVLTIASGGEKATVRNCIGARPGLPARQRAPEEAALGKSLGIDLEVKADLAATAKGADTHEVSYTVRIRNRNGATFSNLVIAHAIWLLMLLLAIGNWRIGSNYVNAIEHKAQEQRRCFRDFSFSLDTFHQQVGLNGMRAEMAGFLRSLGKLVEEARYATRESVAGTEHYDRQLLDALQALEQEYTRLVGGAAAIDATTVKELQHKTDSLAVILNQREAAVKASR